MTIPMNSTEVTQLKPYTEAVPGLELISAQTLQAKEFPPLTYVVDELLVPGMTILAGRPKEGKSWLALSLCVAVATGGAALGDFECDQGDVLYLALEDNQRRLKGRLQKLFPYDDWPSGLHFATDCSRLNDGGLEKLQAWRDTAMNPRLIVIDVFTKVREQSRDGSYEADYRAAEPLQKFAVENGIAVLCIHHTRKMAADDPLESVSGTNGLTGAADSILVLRREAINTGSAVIYGRGRDIPECQLALSFDETTCAWRHLGNASEFRDNNETQEIINALKTSSKPMSPKDVSEILPDITKEVIRKRLTRMAERGKITRIGYGEYMPVPVVQLSQL